MVLTTSLYDNNNPFEPVTYTDPQGPYYQACEGLVNIGKCHSDFVFYCHWFTHEYVASSIPMVTGEVNFSQFCSKACMIILSARLLTSQIRLMLKSIVTLSMSLPPLTMEHAPVALLLAYIHVLVEGVTIPIIWM